MVKDLPTMQETDLIPVEGSPGGGNGNPLQYCCLGNSMDRRALQSTYDPWDCKWLDMAEQLNAHTPLSSITLKPTRFCDPGK